MSRFWRNSTITSRFNQKGFSLIDVVLSMIFMVFLLVPVSKLMFSGGQHRNQTELKVMESIQVLKLKTQWSFQPFNIATHSTGSEAGSSDEFTDTTKHLPLDHVNSISRRALDHSKQLEASSNSSKVRSSSLILNVEKSGPMDRILKLSMPGNPNAKEEQQEFKFQLYQLSPIHSLTSNFRIPGALEASDDFQE